MPEKSPTASSNMSTKKCSCCPYGFHIDRDFVRYCDSLYNSAQLDKLRQHKRERRKEKKSVESYLGLGNLSLERSDKNRNSVVRRNSVTQLSKQSPQEFCIQNDDLKNAVSDFEDTWKKSLKKSYSSHVVNGRNGLNSSETRDNISAEDAKEGRLHVYHPTPSRSSSMSSVSSQSTSMSHTGMTPTDEFCSSFVSGLNASLSSLSKPLNYISQQTVGIHKSVLTNIREQMASSLHRMKELEEQVKAIPALKGKLSALNKEKQSLLNELKLKESMMVKTRDSKGKSELEKLLTKLENEGIMSPTSSRRCLFLRFPSDSLFSPTIASSLDATMDKKKFIEKEIISHLKMNDMQDSSNKNTNKKSIGTSCSVLTREIGVGYVPNKYKSVGVNSDFSLNETLNLFKKGQFEHQTSISSESLESDSDPLSSVSNIPQYCLKPLSLNKVPPSTNVCKNYIDAFTNTNKNCVDKSINTDKEKINFNKYSLEKSFKHKSISVAPLVSNKFVQVSLKCPTKSIGIQTIEYMKQGILKRHSSRDIGIGNFLITDTQCDSCKKPKKSIGVGDSSIKSVFCSKCKSNASSSTSKYENIGVGDVDINCTWCEECQFKKEYNISTSSVGVNTTFELTSSSRDIRICDKCSETIHSVAQDLAADSKETISSKFTSNESKVKISKHKLPKLKTDIQPLKIKSRTEVEWSSSEEAKIQEETIIKKSITRNTQIKDDESIIMSGDTNLYTEESPSSEILPQFTDLPVLPKTKCELNKEIKAACKVLNDHLQKSERGGEKKMLSSLNIIQAEWFRVANQKKADPHLIEGYIDAFEEFSKLLLHKIVNLSDNNGNTALHYAVSYGNFDVVSILIDSKVCDVNMKNKAGYTSIMLVALADVRNDAHHYVVQRLFSIGDINAKASQNGQTALMLAVSHRKKDIVKILLDVGAEINLQDKDGSTALMCAAEHGHLDIAKILLAHPECDPTIVDNDGCNALTIAMEAGHKDIGLLIYANMNFSRGSSPYSTLKGRKRSTPRSTPPPHTPTLRTPPLPSPATKSMNSLTSFQFPN